MARTESAAQTTQIQNLTAEAAELRERLSESIEAARETSQILALSVDDDSPSLEP